MLLWSEVKSLSRVRLFVTPWTEAYQAPPSMGFSRQEYWSGLPCPPPGDLLTQGLDLHLLHCRWSPALQADSLPIATSEAPGVLGGDVTETSSLQRSRFWLTREAHKVTNWKRCTRWVQIHWQNEKRLPVNVQSKEPQGRLSTWKAVVCRLLPIWGMGSDVHACEDDCSQWSYSFGS